MALCKHPCVAALPSSDYNSRIEISREANIKVFLNFKITVSLKDFQFYNFFSIMPFNIKMTLNMYSVR